MLINSQVNCSEGTSSNLLFDYILIDAMDCTSFILAIAVFRAGMQRFLDFSCTRLLATMVSQWASIGG